MDNLYTNNKTIIWVDDPCDGCVQQYEYCAYYNPETNECDVDKLSETDHFLNIEEVQHENKGT